MKRLIIVGNPFQLLLAFMLRNSLFTEADSATDVMIFRSVLGVDVFVERLRETRLFRNVFSINATEPKGNRLKKTGNIVKLISGHGDNISYISDTLLRQSDYNEVWYYNYSYWFYGIYDLLLVKGQKVTFIPFMESVFVYTYLRRGGMKPIASRIEKMISCGRKWFNKWTFIPYTGDVYVQFPEMTDDLPGVNIKKIPEYDNSSILEELIQSVFGAKKIGNLPKYIFMASSLEFDGFGNGETELVIKIAEIVGKENLIVKTHPRDDRGLFEAAGIRVMENSNICWEAIQIVNDFSDNVFLTLASASIINSELFSGKEVRAYYLYPLIKEMSPVFREYCQKSVGQTIDMVHKAGKALDTKVLSNMDELTSVLNNRND